MAIHRIDLRPDLRPGKRSYGKTPMLYNGKVIGASDQPEYAAARWLLNNNAAMPEDKLETYRGEMLCMSGIVGQLAKWTVLEHDDPRKHDKPTLELARWRPFPTTAVRPRTPETPAPGASGHPGT